MVLSLGVNPVLSYVKLWALARFHCPLHHLKCLQFEGRVWEAAFQRCLGCEWIGRSLTLESDVDDGVVLGLGIFVNLHKLFCDKTVLIVCVDAGLHKVLVRYTNPVLVVDAVDSVCPK